MNIAEILNLYFAKELEGYLSPGKSRKILEFTLITPRISVFLDS